MDKTKYYLGIAEAVSKKSSCMRRRYGAILVKNDEIIATGYNGSPRGCVNCSAGGICMRTIMGAMKGDDYNMCASVHAEMNCVISASRRDSIGSILYIVGTNVNDSVDDTRIYANPEPCLLCHRMLINAGVVQCFGLIGSKDEPEVQEIDITQIRFMQRMHNYYKKRIDEYDDGVPGYDPDVKARLNAGLADSTQCVGAQLFRNMDEAFSESIGSSQQ